MLQQTQVSAAIPYYAEWLCRFPDFGSLSRASENDVLRAWQGLGYYSRARNLHATARTIMKQHGGRVPRLAAEMQRLPGIGKYTANAVATFAFDQSVPIIEANTARVLTRVFDVRQSIDSGAGRKTLWEKAAMLVPKRDARTYNSALTDLGALVCISRKPRCDACPVKNFCRATNPHDLPVRKSRARIKRLVERHAFASRQGKILLEQSSTRWRGMWILPRLARRVSGKPLHALTFPFTHHRITLHVFRDHPGTCNERQYWFSIRSLDLIPIPSPHRRVIRSILNLEA